MAASLYLYQIKTAQPGQIVPHPFQVRGQSENDGVLVLRCQESVPLEAGLQQMGQGMHVAQFAVLYPKQVSIG